MTIACGDSHTSTHGAFGAIAFGIGTTQVRDVLASQSLAMDKLKVRRISIHGTLAPGVFAKDVALHVIRRLGVKSGVGHAYEFAGSCVAAMAMEERMTLCNMAIEAGARCGYVNPDQVCFDYLHNRPCAPSGAAWQRAVTWWRSLASDRDAVYVARGRHVADGMKAFVVPGSQHVARAAEAEGLDAVFAQAGFEWRRPGCSMCLAMNPDRLEGRQLSASSSNRNFKGRQGSASGRTLLMSPAMVAAAAVSGVVTDVRTMLGDAKDAATTPVEP